MSTFHGLETARRGMVAQQNALYTTGHNISNANTEGYTRQAVDFKATAPFPPSGINQDIIPGHLGTGVEAGAIYRVRETFLDVQYRGENSKLGYWDSRAAGLGKMEEVMNEPSENGLSKTMDRFWQSLQDLAVNPEDSGARSVVKQRGEAVVETFHYLSRSLTTVQDDIGHEISVSLKSINSISRQIADLNKQISEVEPNGYLPNDLYDARDKLLDQLSQFVDIKVENVKPTGNASGIAEGMVNVSIVDKNGQSVSLITGKTFNHVSVTPGNDIDGDGLDELPTGPIEKIRVGGVSLALKDTGTLKGLIDTYGYVDNGQVKGLYPEMLDSLDKMAYTFATQFNNVHEDGFTLPAAGAESVDGKAFFAGLDNLQDVYKGAASSIKLSADIEASLNNIAASTVAGQAGNGENALNLANVKSTNFATVQGNFPINAGTVQSFYEALIGKMGVDSQEATRLKTNSNVLRESVETRRQSVSGVSLDEEMTNMIKFQHAYNASARNLTMVDEMLDTIINRMGV